MIWVGSRTVSVKERNDGFEGYQGGKVSKIEDVGGEIKGEVLPFFHGQPGRRQSRKRARWLDVGQG